MMVLMMPLQKPLSSKRRAAEARGRCAEDEVAGTLQGQGFTVLARRLRTGVGELDLVVANDSTLVFVEVKARNSRVEAAHSVAARQQARLLEAASMGLAMNPGWERGDTRFDVALVCHGQIEIIEDAIRYP